MRDELGIYTPSVQGTPFSSGNPQETKLRQMEARKKLRAGLGALPKPKNEFTIVMPEIESDSDEDVCCSLVVVLFPYFFAG